MAGVAPVSARRVELLDGRLLRITPESGAIVELPLASATDGRRLGVRAAADLKLPRPVVLRVGATVWRFRVRRADDGTLHLEAAPAGPFAEAARVTLDGTVLTLGPGGPPAAASDAAGAEPLRAIPRGDGAGGPGGADAVGTVGGPDGTRLDLAALGAGVWDLRVGAARVGRHLDGFSGLARAAVLPGVTVPAGWAQPFWTVEDNLSVRVGEPPPADPPARAEPGDDAPGETWRRRRLAGPAVLRHRAALRRRRRPAPAGPHAAGAPAGGGVHSRGVHSRGVHILLLHAYGMGGTIRTTLNLAGGLAAAGRPVTLLSLTRRRDRPFFPLPDGVEVVDVDDQRAGRGRLPSRLIHPDDFAFPWSSTRTDARLAAALAAIPAGDVLIVTRPAFVIAAAHLTPRGVTVVAQEHLHLGAHRPRLRRDLLRAVPALDAVAVLTAADERSYAAALDGTGTAIARIPNAVPPLGDGVSDQSRPTLVAAGRLNRQKGFDLLLDAWATVAPRHPAWTLRIHGTGPAGPALRRQVLARGLHDSVLLPGQAHRLGDALRDASAFVLSSRWEGFGMVLVEAMSKRLPVVSFACPHGPEEIVTDGVDGTLVAREDVGALAAALDRLLGDAGLRERQADAALRTAAGYDVGPITARWLAWLDRLCD